MIFFYFAYVLGIIATWFMPAWFDGVTTSWDIAYMQAKVSARMESNEEYFEFLKQHELLIKVVYSIFWGITVLRSLFIKREE